MLNIALNLGNYRFIFTDPLYFDAYLSFGESGAVHHAVVPVVGYPMAYAIARSALAQRNTWLMLVMLLFWTSFRCGCTPDGPVDSEGLINHALLGLGLIDQPLQLLHTAFSVQLVMVHLSAVHDPALCIPIW